MPQSQTPPDHPSPHQPSGKAAARKLAWPIRAFMWMAGIAAAGAAALMLVIAIALAMAYPNLPDISELSDYRPKLPLRIYSAEGALLAEFGEERRQLTPISEIPQVMKDAVLAIEDSRFFEHGGVDYKGMLRAAIANLGQVKSQGASTITMQVARNVYLSSEKTFTRKIYEILLTFKLEHLLTKDQILEIYMNQIFLGNRAYGFSAAADAYFGKKLSDISIAEAAMLAGLPKAPSAYNPINNPKRARTRQLYIIERMRDQGFITPQQAKAAAQEPLQVRASSATTTRGSNVHGEFVAEMARQLIYAQYGADAYTRGLHVYTTINAADQEAAYAALRNGIMDYERRQRYRGPEKFLTLPSDPKVLEEDVDDLLADHPDNGDVMSAVVLEASARKVIVMRPSSETLTITGEGLKPVQSGLSDKAAPNIKIRRGAVVRVAKGSKGQWELTQLPEVEGAFVAVDPRNGAIKALVGGFDFGKNKFNHATQAWRQPGSSFKPFIYSAAIEKGFSPTSVVDDAPLFYSASTTGGQPWEPKNYDGRYDGPMTLRTALAKSKNMVSIRLLEAVGPKTGQQWLERFGFEASKHPPYLTLALGAGSVTPLQMATSYSVFANGGYSVNPWLISRVTDYKGKVISEVKVPALSEADRVIPARNAFITNSLMQEVTRSGTAARASSALKRRDIYGKTGTTNDSIDAWFAGFHPTLAAVVWMGYDTPRNLGSRETGGGLSLPIWIRFMEHALRDVPVMEPTVPPGVVHAYGDWFYEENVRSPQPIPVPMPAGGEFSGSATETPEAPGAEERKRIMDLFAN